MKKKVLIIISVIFILLFIVYNVGFQFGNITIGKQFDDIERNNKFDIENSKFSKDYLLSDNITVINLWASWCKPCIEEMPIFIKMKKDFPTVKFATLSIDKDEKKLTSSIKDHHINDDITLENSEYRKVIRNFLENRELKSLIKNEIVPVTYIIKNKKVVYKLTGAIDYDELRNKLNSLK
ncbi:MAG: TlpA family protein disulfide reductase [Chryseobacterium sp.]|jgi:thiol-disulfide isomerase/thioredoxin|nr:TlpA family protein disulfide reductase [Chryseobacterium sp.]